MDNLCGFFINDIIYKKAEFLLKRSSALNSYDSSISSTELIRIRSTKILLSYRVQLSGDL